jgi:hypothetical protein
MTRGGRTQRKMDNEAEQVETAACGLLDCLCDNCKGKCDCALDMPDPWQGRPTPPGGYRNEGSSNG